MVRDIPTVTDQPDVIYPDPSDSRDKQRAVRQAEEIITEIEQMLQDIHAILIQTADDIQSGKIHPAHAANRLRKLARQLDK